MAKTYKKPSLVSGMKVQDILTMDIQTFNALSLKELRMVTGRLVSAGNKRIRSFAKAGVDSPALGRLASTKSRFAKAFQKKGIKKPELVMQVDDETKTIPLFSTKGLNLNQLRSEFIRAKNFLLDKTSNLRDWRKIRKGIISDLQSDYKIVISDDDFDKLWRAFEKLKELNPSADMADLKYDTLKEITDQMEEDEKNKKISTAEDLAILVSKKVTEIYEQQQKEKSAGHGVSQFFKRKGNI